MEIFQVLLLFERIHAGPKTFVRIGNELLFGDQPMKRFVDQIFTFLHVIEDLATKSEKATVNHVPRPRYVLDLCHNAVSFERHSMKARRRSDSRETSDFSARHEVIN